MERKSRKSPGKDKLIGQIRKDIALLIGKLMKLTGIFHNGLTPLGAAKSLEIHAELEAILNSIRNLESGLKKNQKWKRHPNLGNFVKWLQENGAIFDGVEISEFEGYDLGLKATKEFEEHSLILTVPKKLMMSEQDAKDSELGPFIEVDPLLQTMPNITLALFLLLEKNKPDSFWKPYLDVLPEKYATVLYFSPEEMEQIKPSPLLEISLKLYRSIARQYAYFYNKIFTVDMPIMKKLHQNFTFENYRWAVSTVMTRQNHVKSVDGNFTAFIPLWDMCNHEQGQITTDFNKDLERGECYALRKFTAGEQIFIFYGARPNCELFMHNGFVDLNNLHDELSIFLGISSSDPLHDQRQKLLEKLGLAEATYYTLNTAPAPLSAELLAFIRIFNMNEEELKKWSSKGIPGDLVNSDVCADVDCRAYKYLETRCKLLRAMYDKHAPPPGPENSHRKNIRLLKQSEVQILDNTIMYLGGQIKKLSKSPTTE